MPTITVFRGQSDGIAVKSTTTKPDELAGDNVLLRVTASGVCGTDLRYRASPMVLGHEGVGIVEAVGPACQSLKTGDRVGWGYEVDSCSHCMHCVQGTEQFCPQRSLYGMANHDQGSFASHAIWREAFLHKIPDGLSDAEAAPLQCAGATTFAALENIRPGDTVGILGVGGLGHLAIQFASKMGCRVVVLSNSENKRDEAMNLGAHEFVAMKDATQLQVSSPLNRLLVTASVPPRWDLILPIMAPQSTVYPLSVTQGNFEVPYIALILKGIAVKGSLVASRNQHRKMLEFAALHQVKPIVEKFPMTEEGINQAMGKLARGEVYYRAVLVPVDA
ncbi:NAD(P)-dependent alcohol dehydrogenase [Aspergillus melleus]|uniref:NAD(P)-dependent alcohol dehydrogenase n=1 Tax=Aspergillus melleus TaxID=138277 RepID=UPI001E8DF8F3|nr:uncharacterized protein LDX57_004871 [Aspergillus melleus]KAH8427156.1 hypothetical protein LDX57_004871 [Aspergillus melleus]